MSKKRHKSDLRMICCCWAKLTLNRSCCCYCFMSGQASLLLSTRAQFMNKRREMEHRPRWKIKFNFFRKKCGTSVQYFYLHATNFLKFLPIKIQIQTSQRGSKCIVILFKDGHSFQHSGEAKKLFLLLFYRQKQQGYGFTYLGIVGDIMFG